LGRPPPIGAEARRIVTRAAVVLAAGRGTRMRSDRAKVLHELAGEPLVAWVLRAVRPVVDRTVVVVGHEREAVASAVRAEQPDAAIVVQHAQEGTGHALACAAGEVAGADTLLVLAGDVPGLRAATLARLVEAREGRGASAAVLTFRAADPTGYGRILRDSAGDVEAIVEDRDCDLDQRGVDECSSGTWAFEASAVLPLLPRLPRSERGELYLTDVVPLLRAEGGCVVAVPAAETELSGVNTPEQLAALEARWRARSAGDGALGSG
jgi:bifunctional UDP-N-acetylglucosamine pyrophosphorylase/glucosamine-1-phosphate N-acetyltransferase